MIVGTVLRIGLIVDFDFRQAEGELQDLSGQVNLLLLVRRNALDVFRRDLDLDARIVDY